jgi:magnesium-transporting ATPase (P-type)
MATVYEDDKKTLVFVKGAPDFLLSCCKSYVNSDGGVSTIDEAFNQRIQ